MKSSSLCMLILPSILFLTACNDKSTPASSDSTSNINATAEHKPISTDAWLGKWNGPEGTFIEIAEKDGKYTITIADLDGPDFFP